MLLSCIYLFYLILPFQIALNPFAGIDLAMVRLIIPLLTLLFFIHGLLVKKLWLSSRLQTPLIISFLFLNFFSLIGAQEITWGLRKLLFLFSFFPFYFVLTALINTHEKVLRVTRYTVYGSIALATVSIIQFLLQFFLPLNTLFRFWTRFILPLFLGTTFAQSVADYPSVFVNVGGHTLMRTIGTFPDPHMLSFYLGMTAPLALGLAFAYPSEKKFFLGGATIILLADLLTFSRGGYLGLIAGLVFILALQYKHWTRRSKKIIIAMLCITTILVIASPIGTRLTSSFNIGEGSNQGRLAMWRAASAIIIKHPFTGVGLGNYSLAVLPSAHYRDPIYAHNLFLDIAAETGILNACIFAIMLIISFFALIHQTKRDSLYIWPAISLIIFSTHSLVETPLYSVHILPLLILLIAISARSK